MKATGECFSVVLLIMLRKVVRTYELVGETLLHKAALTFDSNESH